MENQTLKKEAVMAGAEKIARILSSRDLFQGRREVIIQHSDQQYRLQITKAGKLILNK